NDGTAQGYITNLFSSSSGIFTATKPRLNDQGEVLGVSGDLTHPLVVHFNNATNYSINDLGALGGTVSASAINNFGQVALSVNLTNPIIYNYQSHTQVVNFQAGVAALRPETPGLWPLVSDMNDFSEVIGLTQLDAWLYSENRVYSLQSFVSTNT